MLALSVGLLIGLVLGLTGAGGSVFALPLLVFLLGQSPQEAVGISLGAVGMSALYGVMTHLRAGQIQWLPAAVYATIGAAVAPLGMALNRLAEPSVLMFGFMFLVLVVAVRLWRQASRNPSDTQSLRAALPGKSYENGAICKLNQGREFKVGPRCLSGISLGAALTGLLSGLFGVGGGFLIVPSLLFLTGISMRQAVSTSLVVIAVVSLSGFVSFLSAAQEIRIDLLMWVSLGGISGMTIGVFVGKYIAGPALQKMFAVLMLVMAAVSLLSMLMVG